VIDRHVPFENYKLLIFPDDIYYDDSLADQVKTYLSKGGKVLLTGCSGQRHDGSYALDIGADL
jgi:beta-galactosidase GanA